jgi:hypothetical protein
MSVKGLGAQRGKSQNRRVCFKPNCSFGVGKGIAALFRYVDVNVPMRED